MKKEQISGKKEKLAQFNRDNILDAAEKLFAQKGIVQTTMDDIAKAADYSKSTIYVYFKSKEEIYNHIILLHMCQLEEAVRIHTERQEGFEACYFDFCNQLVGFYEQYPLYFEGMMGKISIDETEMRENETLQRIYEVGEKINEDITRLIDKGRMEGYLCQELDRIPTGLAFWASLSGLITLAHMKEAYIGMRTGMTKKEFLQYGFQMLIDAIRRRQ